MIHLTILFSLLMTMITADGNSPPAGTHRQATDQIHINRSNTWEWPAAFILQLMDGQNGLHIPAQEDDGSKHLFHFHRFERSRNRWMWWWLCKMVLALVHLCWIIFEMVHFHAKLSIHH